MLLDCGPALRATQCASSPRSVVLPELNNVKHVRLSPFGRLHEISIRRLINPTRGYASYDIRTNDFSADML